MYFVVTWRVFPFIAYCLNKSHRCRGSMTLNQKYCQEKSFVMSYTFNFLLMHQIDISLNHQNKAQFYCAVYIKLGYIRRFPRHDWLWFPYNLKLLLKMFKYCFDLSPSPSFFLFLFLHALYSFIKLFTRNRESLKTTNLKTVFYFKWNFKSTEYLLLIIDMNELSTSSIKGGSYAMKTIGLITVSI